MHTVDTVQHIYFYRYIIYTLIYSSFVIGDLFRQTYPTSRPTVAGIGTSKPSPLPPPNPHPCRLDYAVQQINEWMNLQYIYHLLI